MDSPQNRRYADCEISARLPGYRSQSVSLFGANPGEGEDLGVLLLHRLGPEEPATVDMKSLAAPAKARKAYTRGLEYLEKRRPEEARRSFVNAVQLYPGYAAAWLELGKLQLAGGEMEGARSSFTAAIRAEPRLIAPYMALAVFALYGKNWTELADVTNRALKMDPFGHPQAFFLNALANYELHNMDAAEKSVRAASRLDTRRGCPAAADLLAVILASREDRSRAAVQFPEYFAKAPQAAASPMIMCMGRLW